MQPEFIVLDWETSGLDVYNPTFKVTSLALAWLHEGTIRYWVSADLDAIEAMIKRLSETQVPIICHNIAYDWSVTLTQFPQYKLNWYACSMRLTQLWDNGGMSGEMTHFGLEACCGRILSADNWAHKEVAYKWIRDNVTIKEVKEYKKKPSVTLEKPVKSGQEGKFLNHLPSDILEKYNKADVEVTLKLYIELKRRFEQMDFDWRIDHELFLNVTKHIIDAKIRGVRVNLEGVYNSLEGFNAELEEMKETFKEHFKDEIVEIEQENGKEFKINSTKNLRELFCEKLGREAKILTKVSKQGTGGGRPSFSKKHLSQWGEGSDILLQKGSLQQVIGACHGLIKLVESSHDRRWHCDLKTVGTRTGRFAGTGGLNVQGVPRRNQGFMQNLLADEGKILVGSDLVQGEPTATTHYSGDLNYNMAIFGMVGKEPYYKDGILYINDLYLMSASVSPMFKDLMKSLFDQPWPCGSFGQQWLVDSEVIKKTIKKERQLIKMLVLAMAYGAGVGKLYQVVNEAGYPIAKKDIKKFLDEYWNLFAGVKCFAKQCEETVTNDGCILNEFGYRNVPEPHKAFNALIQSTISGIINLYVQLLFSQCPWAEFITIIHDEVIYQIPENKVQETKIIADKVIIQLNEILSWGIKVIIGFTTGKTFYDCK